MIETLRQLMLFVRNIGLILSNKANLTKSSSNDLLISYLFLKLIFPFSPNNSPRINKFRFLNHHLYYFDLKTTTSLIESIFIENEYFFQTPKTKPYIIDLGSNIGLSIIYHKLLHPEASIECFEPDPSTYKLLKKNIKSFNLKKVKTHNKAVSDKNGKINFYVDKNGPGSPLMSTIQARLPKDRITASSIKLSRLINNKIDLLKMDIEGSETKVLIDLDKNQKLNLINQLSIEYHHHISPQDDNLSNFIAILEKNHFGYQIHASQNTPFLLATFEDIQIHAYLKTNQSATQ